MTSNFDRYERIAPLYDLLDLPFEYGRYRHIRPLLFKGIRNILHAGMVRGNEDPVPARTQVVGIDISPAMLARAEQRAKQASRYVDLRPMDVTSLSFPDRSF